MTYTHTEEVSPEELTLDIEVMLTCTEPGQQAVMPSMNFPGEPGHGPEFDLDGFVVNGKHFMDGDFENIFGKELMDRLVETAETKAAESGEFG